MSQPLSIFQFNQTPVRTLWLDGEPWFVATDVRRIIGTRIYIGGATGFPDDEKRSAVIETSRGPQTVNVVNEAGLYRLIFTSRAPLAETFKKWVFSDLLPTLRKTGRYQIPGWSDQNETVEMGMVRLRNVLEQVILDISAEKMPATRTSAVVALARQYRKMIPEAKAMELRGETVPVNARDIETLIDSWRVPKSLTDGEVAA